MFEDQGSAQEGAGTAGVDFDSSQDLLQQLAQHAKAVAAAAEATEHAAAAAVSLSLAEGSQSSGRAAHAMQLQTASTAERAVDEVLLELNDLLTSSGMNGVGRLSPFGSSAIRQAAAPSYGSGTAVGATPIGRSGANPESQQKSPVKKKVVPVADRAPWDNSKVRQAAKQQSARNR